MRKILGAVLVTLSALGLTAVVQITTASTAHAAPTCNDDEVDIQGWCIDTGAGYNITVPLGGVVSSSFTSEQGYTCHFSMTNGYVFGVYAEEMRFDSGYCNTGAGDPIQLETWADSCCHGTYPGVRVPDFGTWHGTSLPIESGDTGRFWNVCVEDPIGQTLHYDCSDSRSSFHP